MRTRAYIMVVVLFVMVTGARAQSSGVRFSQGQLTTREALAQVRAQTGYGVAFNGNLLDAERVVKLSVQPISLDSAMNEILAGSGLSYAIAGNMITIRQQQKEEASGPVKEAPVAEIPKLPVIATPTTVPVFAVPTAATTPTPGLLGAQIMPVAVPDEVHKLPRFALKTNLVYGAAWMTPNLSAEVALSPRSTVALSYSNNPWSWKRRSKYDNTKLLHGVVLPEYRYWFGERFKGHFVGAHALYAEYNVSGRDVPTLFEKEYRYQGTAVGGGLSYGYSLPLSPHWSVEFTVGVGVARMKYDRFTCRTCDENGEHTEGTWVGPTRLGINMVWNFGHAPVAAKAMPPAALPPPPPPPPPPAVPVTVTERIIEIHRDTVTVVDTVWMQAPAPRPEAPKPAPPPREEGISVYFHQGSRTIDPTYMDNARALERLRAATGKAVIVGSASPEGETDDNELLALMRAVEIKIFLLKNTSVDEDQVLTRRTEPPARAPAGSYPYLRKATYYEQTQ